MMSFPHYSMRILLLSIALVGLTGCEKEKQASKVVKGYDVISTTSPSGRPWMGRGVQTVRIDHHPDTLNHL